MLLARAALLMFGLYVVFGQRLTVGADTGGRGAVSPLEMLFVILAAALWVNMALRPDERPPRAVWVSTVGPLFALLLLAPLLGALFNGYEPQTLYSWMVALVPLGILTLGSARRRYKLRVDRVAFAAILAHGLYGAGQMLYRLDLLPASAWGWAARWDVESQIAFSEDYLVYGRSTGLFINANVFGLWSVLAVVYGAFFLRGHTRTLAMILGVVGVAGSQSRTAWVALAVLATVGAIAALRRPRVASRAVTAALVAVPAVLVLAIFGLLPRLVETDLVSRLVSGWEVLTLGVEADQNLSLRLDAWARASDVAGIEHPFGTFGPPQVAVETFIDNQYLSLYLQGGILLLAAYLLALLSPLVLARRGVVRASGLGVMACVVAIFSVTMLPLDGRMGIALVWLAAGASVATTAARASAERPRRLASAIPR